MVDIAEPMPRKSKKPLLIGVLLAVVGGGAGFALTSGLIPLGGGHAVETAHAAPVGAAFVPLDPLIISLAGSDRHLRFTAQLEVDPAQSASVAALTPRIVDVLNGYMRAVGPSDLEDPAALPLIRSHLLHRIGLVVGSGAVRDLLIMEFTLD